MKRILNTKLFEFNASSLIMVQVFASISAIVGLWFVNFTYQSLFTFLLFYFLYIGVGVSCTLHRYYSHKSFEFKSILIKNIFTIISVLAGRGSPLGWVYIHREHHANAETKNDPHSLKHNGLKGFFIPIHKNKENINKALIKEFFTKDHLLINRYYLLILILYILILFTIDPWLFYFGWALPVSVGHLLINIFTHTSHRYGYSNFERSDNSKNFWIFGFLLFGEGWHNNHHADPKNYNLSRKWWEIDPIAFIIKGVKK